MQINPVLGFFVVSLLLSLAASTSISDAVFESHSFTARSLLQTQKNCPINFENQNYTIITSQCKGPKYPAEACCKCFKEFACPFADELNDMQNNCASTMFSYINLYGKYPPGLFANECVEDKKGLKCEAISTNGVSKDSANSAGETNVLSPLVVIVASSLVFLFH